MPIVKVIEVIAHSDKNFDDAVVQAVAEVSKTVRNIDSVFVKDQKVHVPVNPLLDVPGNAGAILF